MHFLTISAALATMALGTLGGPVNESSASTTLAKKTSSSALLEAPIETLLALEKSLPQAIATLQNLTILRTRQDDDSVNVTSITQVLLANETWADEITEWAKKGNKFWNDCLAVAEVNKTSSSSSTDGSGNSTTSGKRDGVNDVIEQVARGLESFVGFIGGLFG